MLKRKWFLLVEILGLGLSIVIFQNCSGFHALSDNGSSSSSLATTPLPSPPPTPLPAPTPLSSINTNYLWKQSLPIQNMTSSVGTFGGTELRALVGFNGSLFASNGYWMDNAVGSGVPGAQIFRLDSPNSSWQVDLQLSQIVASGPAAGKNLYYAIASMEAITFTSDKNGVALAHPVPLLLAGVWTTDNNGSGNLDVFTRTTASSNWTQSAIPATLPPSGQQIRCFIMHTDSVTHRQMVFAGAQNAIYSGVYDSDTHSVVWSGTGDWNGSLTSNTVRVLSMTEANGKLYAGVNGYLLEREDGPSPVWNTVFSTTINGAGAEGIRGITNMPNPSGTGDSLYVPVEDDPMRAYVINPQVAASGQPPASEQILTSSYQASEEINFSTFLSQQFGTTVFYGILSYNHTTLLPDPAGVCPRWLIGIRPSTRGTAPSSLNWGPNNKDPNAYFLIRDCNANYSLHQISDNSVSPAPILTAVRTLVVSPFSSDPPGTLYAGGFDAGNPPASLGVSNSAWLYKGTIAASNVNVAPCGTGNTQTCATIQNTDGSTTKINLAAKILFPIQFGNLGKYKQAGPLGYYYIFAADGFGIPSIYVLNLDSKSLVASTTAPSGYTLYSAQMSNVTDSSGNLYPAMASYTPNLLSYLNGPGATPSAWSNQCIFNPAQSSTDPNCGLGFTQTTTLPTGNWPGF